MIARSKRYKNSVKDISLEDELSLKEALVRLDGFGKAKFDETVEPVSYTHLRAHET